jgi:hypothetical protein
MDLSKWSPRKSKNKKKGDIYFRNRYTGEKVWSSDLYAPRTEPSSYTIINTLDGQVKIPEDALLGLNEWSGRISMLTKYKSEESLPIPTFNVPSSYLIRLISISRASTQYFSLDEDEELRERKRQQIVRMFDAHNLKEFTIFYDEEMEMTGKLSEFMKAIGVAEIKLNETYPNQWSIPSNVLRYSIGRIVDTLDPTFTDAQYTTIAALSYFQHLKETIPESVEGLTITPILLENEHLYIDEKTKTKITTWVPLNIIINDKIDKPDMYIRPLALAHTSRDHQLKYHTLSDINIFIGQMTRERDISPKVREFWKGLYRFHEKCKIPVMRRVWSE